MAIRSIVGNRFDGDGGGQVIHHRPVAGLRSRLRSAMNNFIMVELSGIRTDILTRRPAK